MSRRTPSQQAAIDAARRAPLREVHAREATYFRVARAKRALDAFVFFLAIATVLSLTAGFIAGANTEQAKQGRAVHAP